MKTLITLLAFVSITFSAIAQNHWRGGTPGDETNWNNPRNWSMNAVPDWTCHVLIDDVSTSGHFFPVISSKVDPICSLEIEGGSSLIIEKSGELLIDGSDTFNYGILNQGYLTVKGKLTIYNTGLEHIESSKGQFYSPGIVSLEERTSDNDAKAWLVKQK